MKPNREGALTLNGELILIMGTLCICCKLNRTSRLAMLTQVSDSAPIHFLDKELVINSSHRSCYGISAPAKEPTREYTEGKWLKSVPLVRV